VIPMNREEHARQFLAGMILTLVAGTATIWWVSTFLFALAYFFGGIHIVIFAKIAPSWKPEPETEEDTEQEPGFH